MLLSLGLGWPGPLQGLNNLKTCPLHCLWCCKPHTHSKHSLPVTLRQGSVQAGEKQGQRLALLCLWSPEKTIYLISLIKLWELDLTEGWVPRIDAFELWCWRRFLRIPCTERRSNQSILKEINPEYSLEEINAEIEAPPPDVKSWLTGKDPEAGKDWMQKEKGWQKMRWLHR